jgi:FAD-linked oxidoreductase
MPRKWSNWAGNQSSRPVGIHRPADPAEVARIIGTAASAGSRVKAVGSGHSFTGCAVTNGHLVRLDKMSGLLEVDRGAMEVRVGAGTLLSTLNELLHAEGLAMPNLGDIAYQTVAGAISTSTHGTGARLPGLAAQVRGFTIVDGQGEVHECSATRNADMFRLGTVSVGVLGIVTEYRLAVVEAFRLRALEKALPVDAVLESLDELVASNDHFEFFWLPHTPWALTKRNNRTTDPLEPLPRVRGWIDKTFMENHAFGALCRLGRMRPSLIPRLATALPSSGKREYVEQSHKIFASPRLVRFYEMEHAIPRAALVPALNEIRAMIKAKGYLLNFPVEVRFTAADEVAMSTSYERDSAYIAVHVFQGMEHEAFFRDADKILEGHGSRPHWGKLHHRGPDQLRAQYRHFDAFCDLRARMDPSGLFLNDYSRQVFGV